MHEGHRERLKARFIKEGLAGFEPHQVLELLLFYANPRSDTNVTAHRLIERFGCLSEVMNAPVSELRKVEGIGEHSAVLLHMLPGLFRMYADDCANYEGIATHDKLGEFIKNKFLGEQAERILLVLLDNRFRVLGAEFISQGTVNSATVDMKRLMDLCIRYNATAAILAHNHPRGFALPSLEDVSTTVTVKEALELVRVRLVDHLVVAGGDYVSMASSEKFSELFG